MEVKEGSSIVCKAVSAEPKIMDEPINIIGAGPAGLTAGIVLRKHGFPVKVFEMSPEVGHRLNGDFQGLENWSSEKDITDILKSVGIEINFLCEPYYGGLVYAPEMKPVEIKSDRPIFYLVKRGMMPGTLDMGLKEQALSAGVEILFNHRLDKFEGKAIVATGPKGADAVAAGITFTTSMKDQAVVILDDNIAPKGYAYLLVNQGYGTMVTVLYREYRKEYECFERMMKFFKGNMDMDIKNEKRFGCYGNFFIWDTQVHHSKLYVGESAGFQDGLWGFGMRYAILSGYLAAKSLIEDSDYDMLWQRELRPMLETSLINRFLFERIGHHGYRYLIKKFANGNPCDFLKKHYNYSFFKHLLLPIARKKYESRVKDQNCNHENCTCVWCRCGAKICP
ncbi:MAG: NAD(P)/FAD-dependent oxidoreductase [Nitrospirae bacterium]|nr:MAG: NAD(P)/FAD-dependent oxidoreductase [Nitrospirota bacterium]